MTTGLDLDLDYQLRLEPGLDQFGIGLIGAGFIIRDCHLPAYAQAGFRVLGICSRTPGRADEVAALRGIPSVYRDHRELLADTDIQVVDIGVPPQYQPAIIRDVVRHGAHIRGILAQKPLRDRRALRAGGNYAGGQPQHAARPVGASLQRPPESRLAGRPRAGDD